MFRRMRKPAAPPGGPNRRTTFRPQLEALERREVMSLASLSGVVAHTTGTFTGAFLPPPPTAAGLALINSLPDATVRSRALADYERDGSITRNDVLDIFSNSTTGYTDVSNSALASLKTLVSDGAAVAMPQYVQNLASKVLSTGLTSLSPAQTLKQNVDNFFLGLKRPDFNGVPAAVAGYSQTNGRLWDPVFGPKARDVYQGSYAQDNWLLTGLEEVAATNPADVQRMFIDNGDGTYTVRFFHGSTPDYVTVDNYFPSGSDVPLGSPNSGNLWVALAVKAYIQENATGQVGSAHPGLNDYSALMVKGGGDPSWAFSAITGLPSNSSRITQSYPVADTIASAFEHGHYVALKTLDNSNLVGNVGADPLFYTECSPGDSNCGGYLPPPRWYALVSAPGDGTFTVTEDGKRFIQFDAGLLADNFDTWAETDAPAAPTPQARTTPGTAQRAPAGATAGLSATRTFIITGPTHPSTPPAVVVQSPTQGTSQHATSIVVATPPGSPVNNVLIASLTAINNRKGSPLAAGLS